MALVKVNGDVVHFWCPGCDGAHGCTIAGPNAWMFNGDVDRPTFSPSVLTLGRPPRCHSFITHGRIEFLPDSEHALAGQTVDLPPWPYSD
jgi:hypothetical protein